MPKALKAAGRRAGIMGELLGFLWERKLWWLMPMVTVLLALGIILVFAQSSAIAPFIHTLFWPPGIRRAAHREQVTGLIFWGAIDVLLVMFMAGVARFRRNPRLATASACLLLLLGVALMCEAVTRLYHKRAFGIPLGATMQLYSDPELGWRGVEVMGDPLSMRSKILIIGDSFTTPSDSVKVPEMYYSRLGRLLEVEIFAYGAGGYGTLQELMILERYLPKVRPDLVLLQVHNNDFINNSWELERASYQNNNLLTRPYFLDGFITYKFPTAFSGARLSLATHVRLAYEVTIGVQRIGSALSLAGYLRSAEDYIREQGLAYPPFRRSVDITETLMGRIKQLAAPTPVVVFHAESDDGDTFYAAWRGILQRSEIRFCENIGSSVKTAQLRGEAVRALDGYHWNAAGHGIAAPALAVCLRPVLSGLKRPH
jgi:hypothetical protein